MPYYPGLDCLTVPLQTAAVVWCVTNETLAIELLLWLFVMSVFPEAISCLGLLCLFTAGLGFPAAFLP